MSGFLDGAGVLFLREKIRDYVDKKFSQVGQAPAGEDGKSAYQYAVDGGYTGTEEEFQDLMAGATTKSYVDNLFNQVAPVIVEVQLLGSDSTVVNRYNVKCYPSDLEIASYFIDFSARIANSGIYNVRVIPPDYYAFTGLYQSFGPVLYVRSQSTQNNVVSEYPGVLDSAGKALFSLEESSYSDNIAIVGTFTLEVA